jgi:Ribbon-helix-helix protein, copG family
LTKRRILGHAAPNLGCATKSIYHAGQPATGRDPMISMRLPKAEIASLDKWAKAQSCTRSEAIRRLIRKIKA